MTDAPVAVVTVSYHSSERLPSFLSSVAGEPGVGTVIIVDNASSDLDLTREIAAAHGAVVVALEDNRGYGGAVNAALPQLPAGIRWVLIANPDVVFEVGAVAELLRVGENLEKVGALGPRILGDDGEVYPSARRLPSLRTGIGHAAFSRVWPANPWTRAYRDEAREVVERPAGWLSGACVLVRRTAFEQLGGFDDSYFMYFEDVDLGARLGKAGWESRYVPSATVIHSGAHSTSSRPGLMLRAHHASAYRYLARRYSRWYLAPLRAVLRVGLVARATWVTRSERKRSTGP